MNRFSLLFLVVLCCHGAQAQTIDYVNAAYSVEINNNPTDGQNSLKIERSHKDYHIDFELDHWLVSASQKASFQMTQCKVQPLSYTETTKRPFKEQERYSLVFDWPSSEAMYRSADEDKTFELDGMAYDPMSFFFEARCELMAGKKQFSYPVIRKGRKRTQLYRVVGEETVNTGQGQYDTIVVERERDNPTRQTRLYVAPELGYLLVKFEHQENRLLKVVATLKNIDYHLAKADD